MAERLLTHVVDLPDRPTRSPDRERTSFRNLDRVRILADVEGDHGERVPAGSIGTIVATWAHGAAFEIEFIEPGDVIATVEPALLEFVRRAAR